MNSFILNESWLDQFEKYVLLQMSVDESNAFQQKLSENQELAAAYEDYLVSREIIEQKIESSLRAQLKQWQSDLVIREGPMSTEKQGQQTVIKRMQWIKWAVAASILFVLGLGYSKYQFFKNYPDTLGKDHLDLEVVQLRSGDSGQSAINEVLNKFPNDFEKAISELEKINQGTGDLYFKAHQYIGRMYSRMGKCDEAMLAYTQAGPYAKVDLPMSKLICMIHNGQTGSVAFKNELEEILSDPSHMNYKDAQEIKNITKGYWWRVFNK